MATLLAAAPALLAIALQASQDAPVPALDFKLRPLPEARRQRLIATTSSALKQLTDWLGPLSSPTLTIVDQPFLAPARAAVAGTVEISTRWLSIDPDPSDERTMIRRLARQFWIGVHDASGPNAAFGEGLIHYSSLRAIDTLLQGQQYWSARVFGGFVPYAVRTVPLSPGGGDARGHVPRFDAVDAFRSEEATQDRVMVGLYTLERYIGWPALQQGLAAYRARYLRGGGSPQGLAAILAEQQGRDLSWFFDEAFQSSRRFDYGVDQFTSAPERQRFHVSVVLRKYGDATFADPDATSTLTVRIALADGTEVREPWNGRDSPFTIEYTTASPAVQVTVDPDAILLLDADPSNNTRRLTASAQNPFGLRAAASWFTWLQDLMLTCSALV